MLCPRCNKNNVHKIFTGKRLSKYICDICNKTYRTDKMGNYLSFDGKIVDKEYFKDNE